MCRGFQQNERDHHNRLLNIKAFYLRFSLSTNPESLNPLPLPDSLTLCYLPRINGSPLEINHSKIKPHSPVFVTLHRLVSPPTSIIIDTTTTTTNTNRGGSVYFGSRDRVKASQGARFEVFLREHKVLKGIFRRDWDDPWKMECSCVLEDGVLQLQKVVKESEVCVAADVVMREKVEMVVKRKRRSRSAGTILEEIPEETECELDDDSCCCCCSSPSSSSSSSSSSCGEEEILDMGSSSHFHHVKEEEDIAAAEMEMEGLSWAIDVGIWVMCLGVGFLVSKAASSNTFRRRTTKRPFL